MSNPQPDKVHQIERDLLDTMKTAARIYREAVAEHQKVTTLYSDILDNADGVQAWRTAAAQERLALEKYASAVKAYADLVVHGRHPKPKTE